MFTRSVRTRFRISAGGAIVIIIIKAPISSFNITIQCNDNNYWSTFDDTNGDDNLKRSYNLILLNILLVHEESSLCSFSGDGKRSTHVLWDNF